MTREPESCRQLLDAVLNAFPSTVFIVDEAARIVEANRAAQTRFADAGELRNRRLCGEVLGCRHVETCGELCGETRYCPDCPVRGSIEMTHRTGKATSRRMGRMELKGDTQGEESWFLITVSPLDLPGEQLSLLVLEDVSELMMLRKIIPMCASCRKVRDDRNYWENVETYLRDHTRITFSHGLCPTCMAKLYPEELRQMAADDTPADP